MTIIEFSDFRCPFCGRVQPVVQAVLKSYGSDVRLVFRDFPLSLDVDGTMAAIAGHCADEQGSFWRLHDWMFDHQRSLTASEIEEAAALLGIDRPRFERCLDSGKYLDLISASHRDGEKAGVTGTPAFFINGTMLKGAQPLEAFKTVIDRALAR